jgi:hypothetical protein
MGILIEAKPAVGPPPYGVRVMLECDQRTDIFCRGFETFDHVDGFIGVHADAMRAGWLERQTGQGRKWLCPRCSGKASG